MSHLRAHRPGARCAIALAALYLASCGKGDERHTAEAPDDASAIERPLPIDARPPPPPQPAAAQLDWLLGDYAEDRTFAFIAVDPIVVGLQLIESGAFVYLFHGEPDPHLAFTYFGEPYVVLRPARFGDREVHYGKRERPGGPRDEKNDLTAFRIDANGNLAHQWDNGRLGGSGLFTYEPRGAHVTPAAVAALAAWPPPADVPIDPHPSILRGDRRVGGPAEVAAHLAQEPASTRTLVTSRAELAGTSQKNVAFIYRYQRGDERGVAVTLWRRLTDRGDRWALWIDLEAPL